MISRIITFSTESFGTIVGALALCCALFAMPGSLFAQAPTLDTNLPDMTTWVPVLATAVGAIVAAVLGVYFAFKVVRMGIGWVTRFTTRG